MPPPLLLDVDSLNLDRVVVTREQIYDVLPHRHEFILLDGLLHLNVQAGEAVAFRDLREDEFWVRGHLPGRPIFPGVLMLECVAQLASFVGTKYMGFEGLFIGLSGVDKARFRASAKPLDRMLFLARAIETRSRRTIYETQGVIDGQLIFEAQISGMPI